MIALLTEATGRSGIITGESSMEDLLVRRMDATDADLALFKAAFDANGGPRTLEHLRWQYLDPPAARSDVVFAVDTPASKLAAIYATFPVVAKVHRSTRVCAQSIDTLTDAGYRGRGLFVSLASTAFEQCRKDDYGFVFGFPNSNSAPGFFKRLGWIALDPVPTIIRPLRSGYFLKRVLPENRITAGLLRVPIPLPRRCALGDKQELRHVVEIGPEFDDLWTAFAEQIECAVVRGSDYLRWRLSRPSNRYEIVGLYDGSRLRGYVVTSIDALDRGKVGKVMELVFEPSDRESGRLLMADALRRLRDLGCDAVWALNFSHSPSHRIFRNAGFLSPPRRLLAEKHFGVLPLASEPDLLSSRESWYLSLLDSDSE